MSVKRGGSHLANPPCDIHMTTFELAETISRIWMDVLQVDHVGLHDHFYDLGGNPRLLDTMRRRLQATLQVEVTLVDLCRHPTVISLAQFFAGEDALSSPLPESYERAHRQRQLIAFRHPLRIRFASTQP